MHKIIKRDYSLKKSKYSSRYILLCSSNIQVPLYHSSEIQFQPHVQYDQLQYENRPCHLDNGTSDNQPVTTATVTNTTVMTTAPMTTTPVMTTAPVATTTAPVTTTAVMTTAPVTTTPVMTTAPLTVTPVMTNMIETQTQTRLFVFYILL